MGRGRIIIIDDDLAFVEAACIYLADHGYQVARACCAREAWLELMQARFDVALIDVHLPDIDGTHLATALRRWQPATPIVLISSDDSPDTKRQCMAIEASVFLPKPLVPEHLLEIMSRVRSCDSSDLFASRRKPLVDNRGR